MPSIGIIGGSGLYELFDSVESQIVDTPFGQAASPVSIGTMSGKEVAFITRHGKEHSVPPHLINYRANIKALEQVGVTTLITSSTVGSLRADYAPGHFVIPDQFVDWTWGRPSTFYEGPKVVHVSVADPYCPGLTNSTVEALTSLNEDFHVGGTTLVCQGPRFSTRAESKMFKQLGFDLLSMTQHPETTLAREANMCVVNVSFVSDLDAGIKGVQDEAVTAGMVWRKLQEAQPRIKGMLAKIVELTEVNPECECHQALSDI